MNTTDGAKKFEARLRQLAGCYGYRELAADVLSGWHRMLLDYPLQVVCDAMDKSAEHYLDKMPSAGQVASICRGIMQRRADEQRQQRMHAASEKPPEPIAVAPEFLQLGDAWEKAVNQWGLHPETRPAGDIGKEFFRQLWATWAKVEARHNREWADGTRKRYTP
jgi:hypothetical protein